MVPGVHPPALASPASSATARLCEMLLKRSLLIFSWGPDALGDVLALSLSDDRDDGQGLDDFSLPVPVDCSKGGGEATRTETCRTSPACSEPFLVLGPRSLVTWFSHPRYRVREMSTGRNTIDMTSGRTCWAKPPENQDYCSAVSRQSLTWRSRVVPPASRPLYPLYPDLDTLPCAETPSSSKPSPKVSVVQFSSSLGSYDEGRLVEHPSSLLALGRLESGREARKGGTCRQCLS